MVIFFKFPPNFQYHSYRGILQPGQEEGFFFLFDILRIKSKCWEWRATFSINARHMKNINKIIKNKVKTPLPLYSRQSILTFLDISALFSKFNIK